jgi:hypothetical protein
VFAGLFLPGGAELHQENSQIMNYDNCLPIYLYNSSMLATLYKTGMSVLYSAQCKGTSEFCVQICLKSSVFNFACSSISTFIIFGINVWFAALTYLCENSLGTVWFLFIVQQHILYAYFLDTKNLCSMYSKINK